MMLQFTITARLRYKEIGVCIFLLRDSRVLESIKKNKNVRIAYDNMQRH
jgi:hypothetical protein